MRLIRYYGICIASIIAAAAIAGLWVASPARDQATSAPPQDASLEDLLNVSLVGRTIHVPKAVRTKAKGSNQLRHLLLPACGSCLLKHVDLDAVVRRTPKPLVVWSEYPLGATLTKRISRIPGVSVANDPDFKMLPRESFFKAPCVVITDSAGMIVAEKSVGTGSMATGGPFKVTSAGAKK